MANEIHPARAKILSQNIERMGIANALVTNESSEKLAKHFGQYFDKILCDAPCSGEGMFKKEEQAAVQWSLANVKMCAKRQLDILKNAAAMLKPGGDLLYSTCTFSPEENEGVIAAFLQEYPQFHLVKPQGFPMFDTGRREWVPEGKNLPLEDSLRLWPHKIEGEGHFVALLHKEGESVKKDLPLAKVLTKSEKKKKLQIFEDFCDKFLYTVPDGEYLLFGEQLYLVPESFPSVQGLKVLRAGVHLGSLQKKIFKPAHAFSHVLKKEQVKNAVDFSADSKEIMDYLRGDIIHADCEKGWVLVCADGLGLGFGKASNGVIKNHYPKGLRVHWK